LSSLDTAAIDSVVAVDQIVQGDMLGAVITMAPLGASKIVTGPLKAGKTITKKEIAKREAGTAILTNLTLNGSKE